MKKSQFKATQPCPFPKLVIQCVIERRRSNVIKCTEIEANTIRTKLLIGIDTENTKRLTSPCKINSKTPSELLVGFGSFEVTMKNELETGTPIRFFCQRLQSLDLTTSNASVNEKTDYSFVAKKLQNKRIISRRKFKKEEREQKKAANKRKINTEKTRMERMVQSIDWLRSLSLLLKKKKANPFLSKLNGLNAMDNYLKEGLTEERMSNKSDYYDRSMPRFNSDEINDYAELVWNGVLPDKSKDRAKGKGTDDQSKKSFSRRNTYTSSTASPVKKGRTSGFKDPGPTVDESEEDNETVEYISNHNHCGNKAIINPLISNSHNNHNTDLTLAYSKLKSMKRFNTTDDRSAKAFNS